MKNVIIMGAAGRDFHNFNTYYRNNKQEHVVCFTAAQIPDIAGRRYPSTLAGKRYPKGIPILDEKNIEEHIKKYTVDEVVLAYSDLSFSDVMHKASRVNAAGPTFKLLGPKDTMIPSKKPVIAVTAVRTGCGKSQTTRHVCEILQQAGKSVVAIRHPMPYGDLKKQVCQRFADYTDLDKYNCTIEEREEYEPLIAMGVVVYAGVDYEKILREAEKEADVIVWDGGNNDFPFYKPNLHITLVDPLRPGHEVAYYPGEINLRMADVIIINKEKVAKKADIKTVQENIKKYNPKAQVVHASSVITVSDPEKIKNKSVLVVEDGPTLTHGGMSYGAGYVAAKRLGAKPVSAKPYAVGSIKGVYKKFNHLKLILPAMGYGQKQIKELEQTINKTPCDAVLAGTPIDLRKVIKTKKPLVRVRYELREIKKPDLHSIIPKFLKNTKTKR